MYDGSKLTKIAPYTLNDASSGLAPYNLVNLEWETVSYIPVGPYPNVAITLRHNAICFSGVNQDGYRGLWMVTADANGTMITSNIHIPPFPGVPSYDPFNLTAWKNKLYFTAGDVSAAGELGRGLFVYDPAINETTEIIPSWVVNQLWWQPNWGANNQYTLTVFKGELFFCGMMNPGPGLWRTDAIIDNGKATAYPVYPTPTAENWPVSDSGLQPVSLTTAIL
jgi:hypothetical protein